MHRGNSWGAGGQCEILQDTYTTHINMRGLGLVQPLFSVAATRESSFGRFARVFVVTHENALEYSR